MDFTWWPHMGWFTGGFGIFPLFCLLFLIAMVVACGAMFFRVGRGGSCCHATESRTRPADNAPAPH